LSDRTVSATMRQATTSNQPYGLCNGEDWRKRGRILACDDEASHRFDAGR